MAACGSLESRFRRVLKIAGGALQSILGSVHWTLISAVVLTGIGCVIGLAAYVEWMSSLLGCLGNARRWDACVGRPPKRRHRQMKTQNEVKGENKSPSNGEKGTKKKRDVVGNWGSESDKASGWPGRKLYLQQSANEQMMLTAKPENLELQAPSWKTPPGLLQSRRLISHGTF